jgi:hypothetical protein
LYNDYQQQIKYLLGPTALSVEELETQVAARDKELLMEVIQEMLENGGLMYDEQWLLHLTL